MYAFTDDEVMVERGVLRISRVFVSYDHVQFLDRRHGPIQRKLGLSTIELQTAGGGVRISAVHEADARDIERYVRRPDRQHEQL
jgi:membrane protein YdbS with pleckstrin-like domain